ncbi:MAG: hypothetical protein HY909_14835 [Deltaproteobacteria bacterium]|nr:hypothetical protein [Deltaproteobacteria bacterium]
MARFFNVVVFNKVINTGVTYYSDPQFDDLLGSADVVTLQAIVDGTPGATTVTAQYQTANESSAIAGEWATDANFPAAQPAPTSATDVPKSAMARNNPEAKMGDKGRVAVSCSAQVGVPVRVIACGRRSGA